MQEESNVKIDTRRLIYLIEFAVIAFPLLVNITIPIPISKYTRDYYNVVETIEPGTIVGLNNLASGATYSQLSSSVIRTAVRVWERGGKIVFFNTRTEGVPFSELIIDEAKRIYTSRNPGESIEYDVDYVHMGYIAGEETGFAAFIADMKGIIKVDNYGTPTDQLEMMKNINDGFDLPYMVHIMAGVPSPYMLRQYQTRYNGKMIQVNTDVDMAGEMPFLASGQLSGAIIGVSGTAQYEYLTGIAGPNLRLVNPLSLASMLVLIVLALGNAEYLIQKYRGGK